MKAQDNGSSLRGLLAAFAEQLRVHARSIIPVGAVVAIGVVVVGLLIVTYVLILGRVAYSQLVAWVASPDTFALANIVIIVPMLLLGALASLIWAGVTVQVANAAATSRRISTGGAALLALRRSPRAAVVALIVPVAFVLAVLATPVLVLVGLIGLVVNRVKRRWNTATLVVLAIPFAAAVTLLLRWSLALPSVWLSGTSIRGALADSAARTADRTLLLAIVLLLSGLVSVGVTEGAVAAFNLLGLGAYPELVVRIIAIIGVGPLLPVALALQYRARGDAPAPAPSVSGVVSRRARVAVAVVVSLVIPFMIGSAPAPAVAAGATGATLNISMVEAQPLSTTVASTINITVTNPAGAEAVQPTGDVAVAIDGTPLTGPFTVVGAGSVIQIPYTFSDGTHLIEASYAGDSTFAVAYGSLSVTATAPGPEPTATTTTITITPSGTTAAGAVLNANVVVAPNTGSATPTGSVDLYLNSEADPFTSGSLVAGSVDLPITLPPGTSSVRARYVPDTGFYWSEHSALHAVSKYLPAVVLTADSTQTVFGQTVIFTAEVTAGVAPSGKVRFEATPDGGSATVLDTIDVDSSGVAQLSTGALAIGDSEVTAYYVDDSSVADGDDSVSHRVVKASTTVGLSSSVTSPAVGAITSITVTVSAAAPGGGTPTGTATVYLDGVEVGTATLAGGSGTLTNVAVGDAGTRVFSAEYDSDDNFAGGSGSLNVVVGKADTQTRLLTYPGSSFTYGSSQTYSGNVSSAVGVPAGTVTVYVGGTIVGVATLSGGIYSLTTTTSPASSSAQSAWAIYNGDGANHNGSDSRATTPGITVTVNKVTATPVLTATTGPHTVGDTVTLTATFASIGAGATGTVTFKKGSTVLGTGAISGGVATFDYLIDATSVTVTAEYAGNGNFTAATSSALALTAAKAQPTVTLSPIAAHYPGEAFSLVATVTLPGGLAPSGPVEFRSGASVIGTATLSSGTAILAVCAGATCASGIALGTSPLSITAHYDVRSNSLAAQSGASSYVMARFATSIVFDVNPTTVQPNSGISLTATVDAIDYSPAPTGSVNFYGVMPGGGEYFLVNQPMVNGIATKIITVGTGANDLRWPAEGVVARYAPDPLFSASFATETITVDRYDLSLSLWARSPVINTPTTIEVTLDHEPGTNEPYTQDLRVTADTGQFCVIDAPFTGRIVSCEITWTTAGVHTVSASYPDGDLIYEPATGGPTAVGFGTGTPALAPSLSGSPVAEFDSTVYWHHFDAGATGTVTVWGDGVLWCSVPIGDRQCTGQFDVAAATGAPVDVRVRYSGDANWGPSEDVLSTTVKRCVTADVTSSSTSLGTVSISTPSNCGTGGYLSGTILTATATPIAPNVFVHWKKLGGSGLVVDTTNSTISWPVTTNFMTWTRVATFSAPCYPVTGVVTGRGSISVYPAPNCTMLGGGGGYTLGTAVTIYPNPAYNPQFSEHDAFYSFGSVPGVSVGVDSSNRTRATATITGALTLPVNFGPHCRPVKVVFDQPSAGDSATAETAENCHSVLGNGYERYTSVTITAKPGDPSAVIAGWSLDGVEQPSWGTSPTQTIVMGGHVPTLTVSIVHCYLLDITIDGTDEIASFKQVGTVNVDVPANCPDGSERYIAGTQVTLTPEILVDGAAFTGWDDTRLSIAASQKGPLADKALSFAMTANFAVTAGFFFADSCSSIRVFAAPDVIAFEDDGCGQGQYFDYYKQGFIRSGETDPAMYADTTRTEIAAHINPAIDLDVYVSVLGDARNCFGNSSAGAAPYTTADGWTTYGPLTGRETCEVTGPIQIDVDMCQRFEAVPQFMGADKLYPLSAIPTELLLPGPNGLVGPFNLDTFEWMQSGTVGLDASGGLVVTNVGADPCTRSAANTFPLGRNVALYGYGPSTGFVGSGWIDAATGKPGTQNPVLWTTTAEAPVRTVAPVFTLTCHRLVLGRGITVVGTPARCPGTDPAENWFIEGTAVQVRAAYYADDRTLHGFLEGVVAAQIAEESKSSKALISFVVVDKDKRVNGDYPTATEAALRAVVQNLKVVVGVLAIMAPIALGMLFPPAGMFFAFLGAMAGIANMIPHGGPVASMFDLVNPTKITTCAARWGFGNAGDPTGGYGVGSLISGTNTLRKVWQGKDVLFEKVGPLGMAGGAASLAYGLYEAGAGKVDSSPQTVEELAGTSTMTGCLNKQWQIVGANV